MYRLSFTMYTVLKVTEKYVQKALVELLSVTLDTREWENAPRRTRGEKPATGGWECIYKGPLLETPVASFGADMSLKGEVIQHPPLHHSIPSHQVWF